MPLSTAWMRTGRGDRAGRGSRGLLGGGLRAGGPALPSLSDPSAPLFTLGESETGRDWDFLALPPVGHSASLSRFREEEEDKMLAAMIKKKGEAPPRPRPL